MIAVLQRFLPSWIFSPRESGASAGAIIQWWEKRRLAYNLIVGATGVFTCIVNVAISEIATRTVGEPIGLPDPPIIAVAAAVVYALGANLCFTAGWLSECWIARRQPLQAPYFGPQAFAKGVNFSVALTVLPAVLATIVFLIRLLG